MKKSYNIKINRHTILKMIKEVERCLGKTHQIIIFAAM